MTYCDRYWECVNGQPELYDCPNGLVFAGKHRGVTEGCDYPWRSNYCEGKTQANPPHGTEHCDWLYGIFGHETSCTRYWTCWNGTATEQLCIGGLLYNENSHSCDWPENVDGCQKHRKYSLFHLIFNCLITPQNSSKSLGHISKFTQHKKISQIHIIPHTFLYNLPKKYFLINLLLMEIFDMIRMDDSMSHYIMIIWFS